MDTLLQDLKYAFRSLRQAPGLFAVAALSLALGVAVNVTIYAGADILLWRPLEYPNASRLLRIWSDNKERGWDQSSVSLADFVDWRRESRTEALAALSGGNFNLADGGRPERVSGLRVSPDFFTLLGVSPVLGRSFRPDEEEPGKAQVAILSDRFWHNRFAGDSQVVGRTLRLDGQPYTVVGILPPRFRFKEPEDLYTPLEIPPAPNRGSHSLSVIGLLRPGATLDQANAELAGIARRLAALYPATNVGMGAHAITLQDDFVEKTARQAGVICMVAVRFVLLIACANVANLLLARATARNRELAVRSALGAARGRLVGQLLTESVILAAAGGALGLLLSIAGIKWVDRKSPRLNSS